MGAVLLCCRKIITSIKRTKGNMMGKTADVQKLAGNGGLAEVIAQLENDLEQKDDLARRLLDQCRYQHLVLSEIHGLADPAVWVTDDDIRSIRAKAQAAISSANKSGLLA
jgi:hypothetical protein